MHPYIFSIEIPWFNITLEPRYYGLFYAIAVLIGSRIVLSEIKRRRINLQEDEALNMTLLIFLAGLIGGRVYEVIFEWSNYYRIKNISLAAMLDIGALCMIIGQSVGRWGNFTNGEAAGPVTDLWTGIVFPEGTAVDRYANGSPVHPTMIYESLGNFLILALLWKLRLRNFRPGMLGAVYLLTYSILRSLLTPLRMDNQYFIIADTKFLAAYTISIIMFAAGLIWIYIHKLWYQDETLIKKA